MNKFCYYCFNLKSVMGFLGALFLMSTVLHGQATQTKYLKDFPFEEIDSRIKRKVNSFDRASSLIVLNELLLNDFSVEQINILKIYKLKALVETEMYDEALTLSSEILEPIDIDPKLEVLVLLERTLLYELLGNMPESKKDLNRIERLYDSELSKVDESYGRFLFRTASWFRVNDRREESMEWARRAIEYGLLFDYKHVSATGYLVMGLNIDFDESEKRRDNFIKGLKLWKAAKRSPGVVNMYFNLSHNYLKESGYQNALLYNDSALMIIDSFKTNYQRPDIYKQRSLIAERMNNTDTALYYQKQYANGAIDALKRSRSLKFRELEFELKKEKSVLENIKLETQLEEASNKESYFVIILVTAGVFLVSLGFLIITLASRNRKINEQNATITHANVDLSRTIEEKEFLLQEVNHRVKNNLAFIQSLIEFQMDDAISDETLTNLESLNNRIHAIAVLHDQFVSAKNNISKKEILIAPYINTIVDAQIVAFKNKVNFKKRISNIKVNLETAVPLGILINELITNSIKHAEPMGSQLNIELKIVEIEDQLSIEYQDNGKSFEINPSKESLGLYIIKTMVLQLRGTMSRLNGSYSILIKKR